MNEYIMKISYYETNNTEKMAHLDGSLKIRLMEITQYTIFKVAI